MLLCLLGQADFSFYFDTGGRRRCYIAPERFYESGTSDPGQLAMQRLLPQMVGPQNGAPDMVRYGMLEMHGALDKAYEWMTCM